MNKLLRFGIIVGLIAGFVSAIYTIFVTVPLVYELGINYWYLPQPPETPFMKIAGNEILNWLIWGAIIGLIYAWVYRVIPGKGVLKGIAYGLFNYLILNVYWITYSLIYWNPPDVIALALGFPTWIIFGLVLGILYEFLCRKYYTKKETKIVQYDMMSGFQPGVIAGFVSAFATFFTVVFLEITEIGSTWPLPITGIELDFSFFMSQLGSQIMWHMMWGIFIALIFPKVYNLVPGKGITKGLVYGLVANWVLNELHLGTWAFGYGYYAVTVSVFLAGGINAIIYGLLLGYLYKPQK
ncbi:hypothetical protein [[Eubacterium] cellulosolvens]